MKQLLIPLILWTFQCDAKVSLNIELLSQNDSTISLEIIATNNSAVKTDSILFYTFDKEDICKSILNIDFINKSGEKRHEYLPCTWIIDLDRITLNQTNSKILKPGDSYNFKIDLNFKDISPYLDKNHYSIIVSLNYEIGNFVSDIDCEICRDYLTSNELGIQINK